MRCVIYARLSTLTDVNAANIDTQLQRCRAYAFERGWSIVEERVDAGESAFERADDDQRPAFVEMIADVRAGRVDVVLAWRPDRLWRSSIDAALFMRDCVRGGVALISTVTEGDRDPSNPSDRAVAAIVAAISEYESASKSARLRAKSEQVAAAGRPWGGIRPFGFAADRVAHDPVEAEAVRMAARLVLDGVPLAGVARALARVAPTSTGREVWSPSGVRAMLTSPRVAGLREHRGRIIGPAAWEPILDNETWLRVCGLFDGRRRPRYPRVAVLAGLIFCGRCDTRMFRTGNDLKSYQCLRARGGCGGVSVVAWRTEDEVVGQVFAALPTFGAVVPEAPVAGESVADLQARLAELAELHFVEQAITRAEFVAARGPLAARLDVVLRARPVRAPVVVDMVERWASAGVPERARMLAGVIDRVVVLPVGRGVRWSPDRLRIEWRA